METIAKLGLELDAGPLETGARRANVALQSTAQEATKMGLAMSAALAALRKAAAFMGIGFGLYQVAKFLRDSVTLAARYETLGVVMKSVGQNAGYSAAELNKFERGLMKAGISMLQSRQTIISMVQAQLDLGQATKLAGVAAAAAVTANLNTSATLQRIMRGIQSGQSEVLRTIGLNVSWEKSYRDLAKQLGVSQGELNEFQKTQARANAVMEAAKPILSAYDAAMGTANKQLGSSVRYLEDLRIKLSQIAMPFYTAGVFAYANSLKLLAANVQVVVDALVGLALVMGARMTRGITQSVVAWTSLRLEILKGNVVMLDSAKAAAQRAAHQHVQAQRLVQIRALEIDSRRLALQTVNANLRVATTEKDITFWRQARIAATLDLRAAERAHTAALTAETAAQTASARATAANTLAKRALAVAMGLATRAANGLKAALAFVGGPWGAALIGIAYLWYKIATGTTTADEVSQKYGDSLDLLSDRAKKARLEFEALAKAQGVALPEANKAVAEARALADKALADLDPKGPLTYTGAGVAGRRRTAPEQEMDSISQSVFKGGLSATDEAYERLNKLGAANKNLLPEINKLSMAIMAYEIAQKQLNIQLAEAEGLTDDAVDANGRLTVSISNVARELKIEQEQLAERAAAYRRGGEPALERTERSQAAYNKAIASFEQWKQQTGNAALETVKFREVINATGGDLDALVEKLTSGNRGEVLKTNQVEYRKALEEARTEARALLGIQTEMVDTENRLAKSREANDRNKRLLMTSLETRQMQELTAATALGEDAVRQLNNEFEVQKIRLQGLTDSLPKAYTDALVRMTIAQQKARRETEMVSIKRNVDADLRQLKVQTDQTWEMVRANQAAPAAVKRLTESLEDQKMVYSLLQKAQATNLSDLVMWLGRIATMVTSLRDAKRALETETIIASLTEETSRLRELAAAAQEGHEALKRVREEQEIRDKTLGMSPADAARTGDMIRERNRLNEVVEKATKAAETVKNIVENMIRGMQEAMRGFFEQLFTDGFKSFSDLFDRIRQLVIRMLAELAAAKIMQKVSGIFEDATLVRLKESRTTLGASAQRTSPEATTPQQKAADMNRIVELAKAAALAKAALAKDKPPSTPPDVPTPLLKPKGLWSTGKGAEGALAMAGIAVAGASTGYTLGSQQKDRIVGAGFGMLGGAATGAAIGSLGGPVGIAAGAVVGAVTGMVAGFFGASKKANEEARKMADARRNFERNLEDFVGAAMGTAVGSSLRGASRQFEELIKESATANTPRIAGIRDVRDPRFTDQSLKAIEAWVKNTSREDIQREVDKGGMKGVQAQKQLDFYDDVQEALKALEEVRKKIKEDLIDGIQADLNTLNGTPYQNQLKQIQEVYEERFKSLMELYEAGTLTTDEFIRANKESEEVRRRQVERVERDREFDIKITKGDLDMRKMVAQGRDYEAEVMRTQLTQQKEMQDAMDKWGQTNPEIIKQLEQVQRLELENAKLGAFGGSVGIPSGYRVEALQYAAQTPEQRPSPMTELDIVQKALEGRPTEQTLQFSEGAVAINLPPGTDVSDPEALAKAIVRELRRQSIEMFGVPNKASDVMNA